MAAGGIQPFTNWMLFTKPDRVKPPPLIPAVNSKAVGPSAYRPSIPPDKDWLATNTPFTYFESCRPAGAARSTANAIRCQAPGDNDPLNSPSVPMPLGSGNALWLPT